MPAATCARDDGATQPTTTVELFFDLVYVFAVTQLSHLILDDLTLGGVASASFLLLVVWWAWICTTWMVNWFDPASPAVRTVLTGVMLASLLMAAALPEALGEHGVLFAASYVALQVGRNAAAARRRPTTTSRVATSPSAASSSSSSRSANRSS
jgi:low temperature requirement protein LtrA